MHDILSAFGHTEATSQTCIEHVIAADLGGTNLRAASIDRAGAIHARTKVRTPQTGDGRDVAAALEEAFDLCAKETKHLNGRVSAFAVAVPGALDSKAGGMILHAPNIKSLNHFKLGDELERRTNMLVILENDANAAAVGEVWQGAARGKQTAICVTLGTGVGGGLVLDGELWRGAFESGGEVGHITVEPEGAKCSCGNRGCLEVYASATAMARLYREATNDLNSNVNSYQIYERAKNGDEAARQVFQTVGRYLGIGLTSMVNVIDPEIIVIGGGAAAGWDMFIEPLRAELKSRAFTERGRNIEVVQAERGDDAGLLGAARLAWQKLDGKK